MCIPWSLFGNGSVKTLPLQRIHTRHKIVRCVVFYGVHVVSMKVGCSCQNFLFLVTIVWIRHNAKYTSDFKLRFKNFVEMMQREDPHVMWFWMLWSWSGGGRSGFCVAFGRSPFWRIPSCSHSKGLLLFEMGQGLWRMLSVVSCYNEISGWIDK
jgi:hypothetical protein